MTPREFSELTGKDITADNFMDEYTFADRVYMAAGNLDKRTFCAEYKKYGLTPTVCALTETVESKEKHIDKLLDRITELENAAFKLIDMASDEDDDKLYNLAVKMIGRKRAVKYSIEKDYGLTAEDREYLITLIETNE